MQGFNIEDLFIGLFLHEVGGRIEDQFGGSVLGKEGQGPFHPFPFGTGGVQEEQAADYIKGMTKPVAAYIAGRFAPEDKKMGQAGVTILDTPIDVVPWAKKTGH